MGSAEKILFDNDSRVAPLGLIAMDGAKELGEKVNWYLTKWANENEYFKDTFLVGFGVIDSVLRPVREGEVTLRHRGDFFGLCEFQ